MMNLDIFEFEDYREYLAELFSIKHKAAIGTKSALARHLNCQSSFISQVCTFKAHLNLEHGIKVSGYFKYSEEQQNYFLTLIQLGRSGSIELEDYFEDKRRELIAGRELIKENIKGDSKLTEMDQLTYYSSWWYSAVHISTALPKVHSAQDIATILDLPLQIVVETIQFLLERGLVVEGKSMGYEIGESRIHIGQNSSLLKNHHRNWRLQSLKQIDHRSKQDLSYSGVIAISAVDAALIKKILIRSLAKVEPVIRDSPEESLYSILLDFYKIT